jgi:hypothetical protein
MTAGEREPLVNKMLLVVRAAFFFLVYRRNIMRGPIVLINQKMCHLVATILAMRVTEGSSSRLSS